MAFTRISDDKQRIDKYLQETTDQGLYGLNTPGQGMNPHYIDDVHMRLEKWGTNLSGNAIDVENDLRGLSRYLNRDETTRNDYKSNAVALKERGYSSGTRSNITDETRATNPAWWHKEQQQYRPDHLFHDPRDGAIVSFNNNISSRTEQKN